MAKRSHLDWTRNHIAEISTFSVPPGKPMLAYLYRRYKTLQDALRFWRIDCPRIDKTTLAEARARYLSSRARTREFFEFDPLSRLDILPMLKRSTPSEEPPVGPLQPAAGRILEAFSAALGEIDAATTSFVSHLYAGAAPLRKKAADRILGALGDSLDYGRARTEAIAVADDAAVEALTGASRDKGLDAILFDDHARCIFLIQTKLRNGIDTKSEPRDAILSFAQLPSRLSDPDPAAFSTFLRDMEEYAADRFRRARRRLQKGDYRLFLFFVSTGTCTPTVLRDALSMARRGGYAGSLELFTGTQILALLRDYLDDVKPIPTLDLEMETTAGVTVTNILQRYDRANKLESWVFPMNGNSLAALFDAFDVRLFARNIRGFLGPKAAVNSAMAKTLRSEPDHFFYYNNGITFICDYAERVSHKGRDLLRVKNPQIINGQQTTRMLTEVPDRAAKASVLVKVIHIPHQNEVDSQRFDTMVSQVVASTNWQNAIKQADLQANDRLQITLERALRRLGYAYLRKRQTPGEARKATHGKKYRSITKETLAQAVAGADLEPDVARSGKDNLFSEEHYSHVFPNADPNYFLPRYWLMKAVTDAARGYPQRGYAKWLVLGSVWSRVQVLLGSVKRKGSFWRLCQDQESSLRRPLRGAIVGTFKLALEYYRRNRGHGAKAKDVSSFFRSARNLEGFRVFCEQRHSAVKKQKGFMVRIEGAIVRDLE